jgi:hypothetical protein
MPLRSPSRYDWELPPPEIQEPDQPDPNAMMQQSMGVYQSYMDSLTGENEINYNLPALQQPTETQPKPPSYEGISWNEIVSHPRWGSMTDVERQKIHDDYFQHIRSKLGKNVPYSKLDFFDSTFGGLIEPIKKQLEQAGTPWAQGLQNMVKYYGSMARGGAHIANLPGRIVVDIAQEIPGYEGTPDYKGLPEKEITKYFNDLSAKFKVKEPEGELAEPFGLKDVKALATNPPLGLVRFWQAIGQNMPLTASLMGFYRANPALGFGMMMAGEAGTVLEEIDKHEEKYGVELNPYMKTTLAYSYGGLNSMLESFAFERMLGAGKFKTFKSGILNKFTGVMLGVGTEMTTEGMQGGNEIIAKSIYDTFNEYELGDYFDEFIQNAVAAGPTSVVLSGFSAGVDRSGQQQAKKAIEDITHNSLKSIMDDKINALSPREYKWVEDNYFNWVADGAVENEVTPAILEYHKSYTDVLNYGKKSMPDVQPDVHEEIEDLMTSLSELELSTADRLTMENELARLQRRFEIYFDEDAGNYVYGGTRILPDGELVYTGKSAEEANVAMRLKELNDWLNVSDMVMDRPVLGEELKSKIKEIKDDRKEGGRVVRAVGEGEEPGGTVPIESGGGEAAAASGIFQESQGEVVQEPAKPVEAGKEVITDKETGHVYLPTHKEGKRIINNLPDNQEVTINGTFYHVTSEENAVNIRKKGFDRGSLRTEEDPFGGGNLGDGVYLSPDYTDISQRVVAMGGSADIGLMVKPKRPLRLYSLGTGEGKSAKVTSELLEDIQKQGYDGIIVNDPHPHASGTELVVFDPKALEIKGSVEELDASPQSIAQTNSIDIKAEPVQEPAKPVEAGKVNADYSIGGRYDTEIAREYSDKSKVVEKEREKAHEENRQAYDRALNANPEENAKYFINYQNNSRRINTKYNKLDRELRQKFESEFAKQKAEAKPVVKPEANRTRERLADDAGFLRLGAEQKRNPFKEMDKHIKHLSREIAKSEMSELRRKQQTKNTKSIPSNREPEPGLNTPPPASLEPDAETLFQSIVRTVQDKLNRLDYYQKKIETITGQPVSEESDVALRARLYIGRASEHIRKFDKVMIENKDSFLARLTKDKLSVDDIGIYLYAKHTKERNAYIASINPAFKPGEGGSGLTDVEAAAILESYKETPVEKYAEEFYNKVTRPALKMRLDAGLITREEYDALNKRWQYYVPLKGKAGIESYLRTGKGFSIGGKEFKIAAGRRSMADNPFVQAMADYNEAVVRSEKNKVARTLKKLIEENPAPDLWAINEVESRPYIDKEGNIQYRDVMVKWADNVVECKENGRTFAITLKDKAMASGMKNLGLGRGIPFLINVNNYLRAINTIVNPKFMVTNFERDIQTALIHVTGEQSTKMSVQTLKYLPDAMRGIWKDVRDKTSNEWSELYADLKERGGKVGWMDVKSVEEEMQRFEKQVAQFKSKGSPRRIMESTLNLISSANEVVESGVRLAFYKTAIENGISRDRAAMAAKNLTVNFNDKGTIGQVMNSLWLFSSAGVNGMARVFKAMGVPFNPKTRGQRRVQTICAGLTMTGFVQAYFNRLTNPDDWDKMSDYNKDNYWLQMLPNGKSIAFKAPYGYNVFLALGRIAEEAVFGNLTLGRAGSRTFQAFNNAFNPLGGGSFIQFIVPTITDPFVQLAENKNFFGGAIAPEQPPFGQPRKPRSQLYFKNVRQTSRIFTDWLNRITGGSEEKSGVIDVSPEWVDHFIDWGTGGLGRFIGEGVETGYTLLAEGSFPDLYNTPVANLFVKASSEYSDVQKISEIYLESKRKTISVDQRKRFYELVNRAVEDGTIEAEDGDKKIEAFKRNQGLPTGKPLSKKPSKLRGKKK